MDTDKIDEAALGLLFLGLHDGNRVWKKLDFEVIDRLHAKGLITNPAGRSKSVALTAEGLAGAEQAFDRLFATDS